MRTFGFSGPVAAGRLPVVRIAEAITRLREFIPVTRAKGVASLKSQLFSCDARLCRKTLEALVTLGFHLQDNEVSKGQRFNVMLYVFTNVVNKILGTGWMQDLRKGRCANTERQVAG